MNLNIIWIMRLLIYLTLMRVLLNLLKRGKPESHQIRMEMTLTQCVLIYLLLMSYMTKKNSKSQISILRFL